MSHGVGAVVAWLERWALVVIGASVGTAGAVWLVRELRQQRRASLRDVDKLRLLLRQLVRVLDAQDGRVQLNGLRSSCPNRSIFDIAKFEVLIKLLGPVYKAHGVPLEWFGDLLPVAEAEDAEIAELHRCMEERCSFGTLGPLRIEKGTCVVVCGLTGHAEVLNGEIGFIKNYAEPQDSYEVICTNPDVGFISVDLPPCNLQPMNERETLQSIHEQQLAVLRAPENQAELNRLRSECGTEAQFRSHRESFDTTVMNPIFQRHGFRGSQGALWCSQMTSKLGAYDPETLRRAKGVEDLLAFASCVSECEDALEGAESAGSCQRQPAPRRRRQIWEVTPHCQGGVPVMDAQRAGKEADGCRLEARSLLEELELDGDRLRFRRLTGSGPDSGWVGLSCDGRQLVSKKSAKLLEVCILSIDMPDDFHCYVALAQGLRHEGHNVRILGPENVAGVVAAHGLSFSQIGPDPLRAIRARLEQGAADFCQKFVLEDFDHRLFMHELEAAMPDLLIYSAHCFLGTFWALNAERKFGIPAIGAGLQPAGLMDYDHEDVLKAARMTWEQGCQLEDERVRATYGVAAWSDMGFERYYKRRHVEGQLTAFLAVFRNHLHHLPPRVREVQQRHSFTGFWFLEGSEDELATLEELKERQRVERFLSEGPAVYLGWGRFVCSRGPQHMALVALGALKEAGLRGVVQAGWAGLSLQLLREAVGPEDPEGLCAYVEANVLFVGWISQTWLFPKCACHVHHGAGGALAASWRSGRPLVVAPTDAGSEDERRHADLASFVGGIRAKPVNELSAQDLACLIRQAAEGQARADVLRGVVLEERGIQEAITYINKLATELESNQWHKRWKVSGNGWREDFGMVRPI
eukprot:CAMPEP_0168377220 /NCGR_PEP_ID=MMETSP0228-20121227/10714_1 /TAXON_ID=133427 /ORGANISM="Protoceratium reticulatum, Strain CCCM 535 (=CCMP 1889)" /LENGTH=862 /DNA_ID=CAMNT_0008390211 /DNA_START=11 /DNA_END=2599 /DNA_ORIENTATION=+